MAKEGNTAPAAAPKKNILMIVVAVIVAIAIGAGAAMMMSGGKKKHRKADMDEMDDSVTVPHVIFKDEIVVNLMSAVDGEGHYIRVPKIELEVASESVAAKIEANRSKIGDRISSTLHGKSYQEMMQPGSDVKLKEDLRKVINDTLEYKDERRGVKEVLLPSLFIVQ